MRCLFVLVALTACATTPPAPVPAPAPAAELRLGPDRFIVDVRATASIDFMTGRETRARFEGDHPIEQRALHPDDAPLAPSPKVRAAVVDHRLRIEGLAPDGSARWTRELGLVRQAIATGESRWVRRDVPGLGPRMSALAVSEGRVAFAVEYAPIDVVNMELARKKMRSRDYLPLGKGHDSKVWLVAARDGATLGERVLEGAPGPGVVPLAHIPRRRFRFWGRSII